MLLSKSPLSRRRKRNVHNRKSGRRCRHLIWRINLCRSTKMLSHPQKLAQFFTPFIIGKANLISVLLFIRNNSWLISSLPPRWLSSMTLVQDINRWGFFVCLFSFLLLFVFVILFLRTKWNLSSNVFAYPLHFFSGHAAINSLGRSKPFYFSLLLSKKIHIPGK